MHNLVLMLAILTGFLAVCGGSVYAQENTEKYGDRLLLESRVPGHSKSIWKHFKETHVDKLPYEIVLKHDHGDTLTDSADVVEMFLHDAMAACNAGDINLLPLDWINSKDKSHSDYISNGLQPCGVGYSAWADLVIFDRTVYINRSIPDSILDFFDPGAFPGKRVMKKSPRAFAEWALLLSGVSPQTLYSTHFEDRAWTIISNTLDTLKSEIIWVDTDIEAMEILDAGTARFAMVASNRLVQRIDERRRSGLPWDHYGVIWKDAIAHMSMLTVPKQRFRAESLMSSAAPERSLELLSYLIEPFRNLQLSTSIGYAPVNQMHAGFIDKKYRQALAVDIQPGSLIWSNDKWWRERGSGLEKKFNEYIESNQSFKTVGY